MDSQSKGETNGVAENSPRGAVDLDKNGNFENFEKNRVREVLMTSQFPNHASVIDLCILALKRIELRIWNASGIQIISISLGDTDF